MRTKAAENLSSVDREQCHHISKMVSNLNDALALRKMEGWTIVMSPCGRLVYLIYRGVEVRLLFKIQMVGADGDKDAPDKLKKHTDDIWLPIDLLGIEEDKVSLSKQLSSLKKELTQTQKTLQNERATFQKNLALQADRVQTAVNEAQETKKKYEGLIRKKKGEKK